MHISDLIAPEAVLADLKAGDKRGLLGILAEKAAGLTGADRAVVAQALLGRENLGSTGMGAGAALPHARLAEIARPVGVFARLRRPIAFDAVDGLPVDLVCALLLPAAKEAGEPLNALACVARRLRDPDLLARLRRASDGQSLYALLIGPESSP